MHLYTLHERHAWFHLYGTSRPATCASKATKCKMKNVCQRWDSNQQPWDLKSDALLTEIRGLCWKLYYLNCLYTSMYFRYQCIHWHKFENDGVQIILSCKCTALWILDILVYLYIGIYLYCTNSEGTHQSWVYFGHAKHDQTFYLIWYLQVESKHRTCASLCYLYHIDIFQVVTQHRTFARQNRSTSFSNLYQCIHWYRKYMYV